MSKRLAGKSSASTIDEKVRVDLQTLKPGVYTVSVTVRDLHTREVVSRFLTFQIDARTDRPHGAPQSSLAPATRAAS